MANLTNKFNYPSAIVNAVMNDSYNKGDCEFSATGLIQPARISALTAKYKDEIESDVDDRIFMLYGQVGHSLLERAGNSLTHTIEKRYFGEVDGVKISAQIDTLSLIDNILCDWKFTTIYGFRKDTPPKPEWVYQLNIQLELLRQNGLDAKRLMIAGLLRDWRPGESAKDKRYPNKVGFHDIPIWPRQEILAYIRARIKAHRDAAISLPECTPDEHWSWRRCSGYCEVSKFCLQFNSYKQHVKESETL